MLSIVNQLDRANLSYASGGFCMGAVGVILLLAACN